MPFEGYEQEKTLSEALIAHINTGMRLYGITTNLHEHSRHVIILRYVTVGHVEGRPYTVSDVSNATGISRATVQRDLVRLKKRRLLRTELRGRRRVLLINEKTQAELNPCIKRANRKLWLAIKDLDFL